VPATVVITVIHVNSPPTLTAQTVSAIENGVTTMSISASDIDTQDTLSVFFCSLTGPGTVAQFAGAALNPGDKINDASFRFKYTAPLLTSLPPASPFATVQARVTDGLIDTDVIWP